MLPDPADAAVQEETPVGPVVTVPHSVAVQLLPAEAAVGVQLPTPTPALVAVLQVVVV